MSRFTRETVPWSTKPGQTKSLPASSPFAAVQQQKGYDTPQGYTPPATQGYDTPQGYTPPATQGYTPPASQGYKPQGYTPSASQGYKPQGYTPPATQGYTPPATQGYTPPASQGYKPQGYTPPATQGYTPSATQGYTPPATQGYKPQGYTPPASQGYKPQGYNLPQGYNIPPATQLTNVYSGFSLSGNEPQIVESKTTGSQRLNFIFASRESPKTENFPRFGEDDEPKIMNLQKEILRRQIANRANQGKTSSVANVVVDQISDPVVPYLGQPASTSTAYTVRAVLPRLIETKKPGRKKERKIIRKKEEITTETFQ